MADADNIRILLADRQPIYRDSLSVLLESEPSFHVVGKTGDCEETLRQVARLKPEVLLLDCSMVKTAGIDLMRKLSRTGNRLRTIIICDAIDADQVIGVFEQGAHGLIMKDADTRMIVEGIQSVMNGKYWFGEKSMETPYQAAKNTKKSRKPSKSSRKFNLTSREMEVIKAVVKGMKTKEIAGELSISEQTVKHHITNIFDKVGVYNRLELTLFAFHHKLTDF